MICFIDRSLLSLVDVFPSASPNDVSYHFDPDDKDPSKRVLPKERFNVHWFAGDDTGSLAEYGDYVDATPYQRDFVYPAPPGFVVALDVGKDGRGYDILNGPNGNGIKVQFHLVESTPWFLKFQATLLQLPNSDPNPPPFSGLPIYYDPFDEKIASINPVLDISLRIYTRSEQDKPQRSVAEKTMYLTGRGVCCTTMPPLTGHIQTPPLGGEFVTWEGKQSSPRTPVNIKSTALQNESNPAMTIKEANLIRNDIGKMMINSVNSNKRYAFGTVGLLDTQFVCGAIANMIKEKEEI